VEEFSFERLDVYKRSLEFVTKIRRYCEAKKGQLSYFTLDQLGRAALSIPLNLAEGSGRWHINEKKKFFWIARGSVYETVSVMKVIEMDGQIEKSEYDGLRNDLLDISMMITKLAKSMDRIQTQRPTMIDDRSTFRE